MFKYIDGNISNWKLVAMTFNRIKQIKVVVISAIDDNLTLYSQWPSKLKCITYFRCSYFNMN